MTCCTRCVAMFIYVPVNAGMSKHGPTRSQAAFISKSATMTTTPLSTPTQIRDSYPRGFGPASVDQLARSSSSKLEAHPSWSRHRHYDDNGSLPSTGTTRRDDDPSHDPHSPPPPSTSSHGKELGNSVSPSKYSDTWLARNDRGEQVNLPVCFH